MAGRGGRPAPTHPGRRRARIGAPRRSAVFGPQSASDHSRAMRGETPLADCRPTSLPRENPKRESSQSLVFMGGVAGPSPEGTYRESGARFARCARERLVPRARGHARACMQPEMRSVTRYRSGDACGGDADTIANATHVIGRQRHRQGDGAPLASGIQASSTLPIAKAIALRSSWSPGAKNPCMMRNVTSRS
jgi:hypothetical protein